MAVLRSAVSTSLVLFALVAPASGRDSTQQATPEPFQFPSRLEGDFTQVSDRPLDGGGKETTTITGHVVWQIKSEQGVDQPTGAARQYEAATLKLSVRVTGTATDPHIGTCQHEGSFEVTPTADQRGQMSLTIDSASQASITLAVLDRADHYDVKYSCKGPIKVPPATDRRYGVVVMLGGPYTTQLKDGKLTGQTPSSIRVAMETITGRWNFVAR